MKRFVRLLRFAKDFLGNVRNGKLLVLLNLLFCTAAVLVNNYLQVFCKPTAWATVVLLITFIPVIFFPVLKHKVTKALPVFFFLFGIAFSICIYCILFIRGEFILGVLIFFFGFQTGVFAIVPHVLALQLFLTAMVNPAFLSFKKYFHAGIITSVVFVAMCVVQYQITSSQIRKYVHAPGNSVPVKATFMAEKIIGMHFKYHTRICLYDGWRPPLHEPMLVIGYQLSGFNDPLSYLSLEGRVKLYQKVFPCEPVQVDCACGKAGEHAYFNDPLFR